jgi:hypothetical protein
MNNNFKNITIQDFLAVIVSIGVFALIICKYAVPDQIWSGWMVILTFFFNQQKNTIIPEAPKPPLEVKP